jgi:hypothetical protein
VLAHALGLLTLPFCRAIISHLHSPVTGFPTTNRRCERPSEATAWTRAAGFATPRSVLYGAGGAR